MGEKVETLRVFIFSGSKITADGDCSHEIKRHVLLWKKSYDQPRQHIKKQRHYFAYKNLSSQRYGFSSSHVWMWELGYKWSWAPKNRCFWTVELEKTLESPLDCKEIKPVHFKGSQSWILIGRTDSEAEALVLWLPDSKGWLIRKFWERLKAGGEGDNKGWMVGWHHQVVGHEFEEALTVCDGQGNLTCCSPWGRNELDTSWLNWLVSIAYGRV